MSILHLGKRISAWWPGNESLVGLTVPDARHHTYVIGRTGSGKSTLLRNLVLQHIHAGHGVALIDPHGDLAADLLDHFPSSRADDLVYFDPSDLDYPVGLNPLFNVPPDQRALVTDGLVGAFKSIWFASLHPLHSPAGRTNSRGLVLTHARGSRAPMLAISPGGAGAPESTPAPPPSRAWFRLAVETVWRPRNR